MTENQSSALVKNPNTKKALAVLQKYAKQEVQLKELKKQADDATELIKQAMIDSGITKVEVNTGNVTGFITLAERINYKAGEIDEVDDEFKRSALDTDKVKAHATLHGELPSGVEESRTQYIVKKFKVGE